MSRRRRGREINGILLLDKPIGLSSNQALQRVKHLFQAAKAGQFVSGEVSLACQSRIEGGAGMSLG